MRNRLISFLLLNMTINGFVSAQDVTFYKDIYPVISKNCIKCHNKKDGVGPFPLETYDDVIKNIKLIKYVTEKGIMPPWKADTSFMHFKNERVLSNTEVSKINSWISNGCIKGKKQNNNTFNNLTEKNKDIDLSEKVVTVKMRKSYNIPTNNKDNFSFFIEPLNLKEDEYLKSIEIIPGNRKLVHHCRIDLDTTVFISSFMKEGNVSLSALESQLPTLHFVGDYVPGISKYEYPKSVGMYIPKNVNVLFNMHYSPNIAKNTDKTSVRFTFYPKNKALREVFHFSIGITPRYALENNFHISKDSFLYITYKSEPSEFDVSLISIQPHMHMFGKSIKIFCTTPNQDTIKLINIPQWDFNWQENYYFNHLIYIPKNSIYHINAVYDNTSANSNNPYIPPKSINFGEMTSESEMMEFYLQGLKYITGDENIKLY